VVAIPAPKPSKPRERHYPYAIRDAHDIISEFLIPDVADIVMAYTYPSIISCRLDNPDEFSYTTKGSIYAEDQHGRAWTRFMDLEIAPHSQCDHFNESGWDRLHRGRLHECPELRTYVSVESSFDNFHGFHVGFTLPLDWRAPGAKLAGLFHNGSALADGARVCITWSGVDMVIRYKEEYVRGHHHPASRLHPCSFVIRLPRCPVLCERLEAVMSIARPLPPLSPSQMQYVQTICDDLDKRHARYLGQPLPFASRCFGSV
jgi:hypothetical protein